MNSNSSLCQQGIKLELSTPLDPHTHSNILHSFMFSNERKIFTSLFNHNNTYFR